MPRRSRSRRRAATPIAAMFGVLLCMGAVYGAQMLNATPTEEAGGSIPLATTSSASATSGYQLVFGNPIYPDDESNRPAESIADPVIASINAATRTVDAATYEFNLPAMADALIAARNRGILVRLLTDTDTVLENGEQLQRVIAAGIPMVEDGRNAIMHDKFVIADGTIVWTGSWNFTENDTYRNNNSMIGITSPEMVANYQAEFDEMFVEQKFGANSTGNTPYPQFTVNGIVVENYFSPDDGVADHILSAINGATQSIAFAAFTFTRSDFTEAMLERAQAGVSVEGVYETRQVNSGSDQSYGVLFPAGLPVLLDGNPYTMHHKFIVIDSQIVITGSYNFTKAAEQKNDENVLIIHDAGIAQKYLSEFKRVWQ
ncbi:MAG TPA: phospholipase D-like domain-containing protein, partial [Anaerolineales bacterium]|nr:phospholipase D-like domain-containing protein [Anaerolineales bacterium]